ncbi:MAG: hypothetical protein ACXVBH_14740 [Flavisolibacter sp.]
MEEQSILTSLAEETVVERRKLLPVWIKVFVWIFMIIGPFALLAFIVGLFSVRFDSAIYGLESQDPLSATSLFIFMVFILKGIVAYGLWTEKDWAVNLGIVDAIIGIGACIIVMAVPSITSTSGSTFRAELILLIPYLITLLKLRPKWMQA